MYDQSRCMKTWSYNPPDSVTEGRDARRTRRALPAAALA
jgi:hypothetical protein